MSPVPVGTQVAVPLLMTSGMPIARTRSAPTTQVAVTQGGLEVDASAQPVTVHGSGVTATGRPETRTRPTVAVGIAGPACMQVATAPWWTMKPGMAWCPFSSGLK